MRRRLYTQPFSVQTGAPISDVNTTPLIDVMLVLLIMFIMTVPIATHKVPVDLPQGITEVTEPPKVHRLSLDASGALFWNGAPLPAGQLPARLAAVKAEANAELHFRTDAEARYERFDQVLAQIKGAGITRLGLVDNQRFASFGR